MMVFVFKKVANVTWQNLKTPFVYKSLWEDLQHRFAQVSEHAQAP